MDLVSHSMAMPDHIQEPVEVEPLVAKDEASPTVESVVESAGQPSPVAPMTTLQRYRRFRHSDKPSISNSEETISPTKSPPKRGANTRRTPLRHARRTLGHPFTRRPPQFHKFLELPAEIRLQIWESALIPRVHELHPCAKLYNERMTFRSNSSLTPSIFHVCRESRQVALKKYRLMSYEPRPAGSSGKGILRFYFCPELDTLFLNSLMGLFIMFMLLEEEEDYVGLGVLKGWQRVAFDAERVQLISLLSGLAGHAAQPRFKAVFPSLKELIIAFDYTSAGKTRFRTSVWPGENGTSLKELQLPQNLDVAPDGEDSSTSAAPENNAVVLNTIFNPMRMYLDNDYGVEHGDWVPALKIARVNRKAFLRGDLRYAFRKTCSFFGLRPRGPFRRL